METYIVQPVDDETAETAANLVSERFEVSGVRIRGLAEAVRAAGDGEVVPDGESGYFEETVEVERIGGVIDALGSLTRVVFYADGPVLAYFDDGKLYLRANDTFAKELRSEGVGISAAEGAPDSVVAEMNEDDE